MISGVGGPRMKNVQLYSITVAISQISALANYHLDKWLLNHLIGWLVYSHFFIKITKSFNDSSVYIDFDL